MTEQPLRRESTPEAQLVQSIAQLARNASIELNVQDLKHLQSSRTLLPQGKRIYISHLPKQSWDDTLMACREVSSAGFDPIPHVPVRLLSSEAVLDSFLERAVAHGRIQEVLLVAGDYTQPAGPYASVSQVLRAGSLNLQGLRRVSLAGYPEGHHKVPLEEIRRAEVEKAALATAAGLETTFVTQFFFEAKPFIDWITQSRAAGIGARLVGGLAGPASVATLFKFAMRCGVGPSVRALGARPNSLVKLIGPHGPEEVMSELVQARTRLQSDYDGVHFFCFGGYLRTCEWVQKVANGEFRLDNRAGFQVK